MRVKGSTQDYDVDTRVRNRHVEISVWDEAGRETVLILTPDQADAMASRMMSDAGRAR